MNILGKYEEITVIESNSEMILFMLFGREYCCIYPLKENRTGKVCFLVKNDKQYDYPHILSFKEYSDKYKYVCLYRNDDMIHFLQTYEEKVIDAVERLIALLSLSIIEQEREFQKEFLYYWNNEAKNNHLINIFVKSERVFQKMNLYSKFVSKDAFMWNVVSDGIKFNSLIKKKTEWKFYPYIGSFYIPIIDNRRILPPTHDRKWTKSDILKIVYGKEFSRISRETYTKIETTVIKHIQVLLVFEMIVDGNSINFATLITFRNKNKDTLLNKLMNDISNVEIQSSQRLDYYHLCKQIGNETSLLNKKVLLVGAGSLGSYIGKELVKSGIKELTVYDSDVLSYENVLRHDICCHHFGQAKVNALKLELEYIHPEISVKAINENIDEDKLLKETNEVDVIIFAVGSSDVQLELNKVLKQLGNPPITIYAWLEAGGFDSHLLVLDYEKQGCFQCLFTNDSGALINNKVNKVSDEYLQSHIISNGCGATRVPYGNSILLRTAGVLLDTMKKVFDGKFERNTLIDITLQNVCDRGANFIERKCQCCGNRYYEQL